MTMRTTALALLLVASTSSLRAAVTESATQAVNALGLDLHRQMPKEGNVCLSPYSIQVALAMTYLGASGVTQEEMARVLHFPKDKQALGESFTSLKLALEEARQASVEAVARAKKYGGPSEVTILRTANRLFGQESFEFRPPFLSKVKSYFGAPLQIMNFREDAKGATREINSWVVRQTKDRIRDVIPKNTLTRDTTLVLVNALYFKASWADEFYEGSTHPMPFHVNGDKGTVMAPTMTQQTSMCYYNGRGFQAVALPYAGRQLHLLLIVPDSVDGIAKIESRLTPELLLACAKAKHQHVRLYLPKFKIAPPSLQLGEMLQKLGMTTAFDNPLGSADFDAMAPKSPKKYLALSKVFHKTFLALDEKGTEAAAATVAEMFLTGFGGYRKKPIEIKADRPFLFAIQHAESGACLFLGRVGDPR
jgi:serpin B